VYYSNNKTTNITIKINSAKLDIENNATKCSDKKTFCRVVDPRSMALRILIRIPQLSWLNKLCVPVLTNAQGANENTSNNLPPVEIDRSRRLKKTSC
jgi:hypothetical protein